VWIAKSASIEEQQRPPSQYVKQEEIKPVEPITYKPVKLIKPKKQVQIKFVDDNLENLTLEYPFKSEMKRKKFLTTHPQTKHADLVEDSHFKKLKNKMSRPTFGSKPHTYEMYHMQRTINGPYYLFIINVNTRFLYVRYAKNKSAEVTLGILQGLIDDGVIIRCHKFDGDKGFNSNELIEFYESYGINWYMPESPFTYHNKMVDAVMRTLRNALGPFSDGKLWNNDVMQQLVTFYNNTYHISIKQTPAEFMSKVYEDVDYEWQYIRKMTDKLELVEYWVIIPVNGSIVMVHLDFGKRSSKFDKRRRVYEDLGLVIDNDSNGNIRLVLLTRFGSKNSTGDFMNTYFDRQ